MSRERLSDVLWLLGGTLLLPAILIMSVAGWLCDVAAGAAEIYTDERLW